MYFVGVKHQELSGILTRIYNDFGNSNASNKANTK
jgi:hypothetical protein